MPKYKKFEPHLKNFNIRFHEERSSKRRKSSDRIISYNYVTDVTYLLLMLTRTFIHHAFVHNLFGSYPVPVHFTGMVTFLGIKKDFKYQNLRK